MSYNKITLHPAHSDSLSTPPVDYWPIGHHITQHTEPSRYLRNFYQVRKFFSAFIKSV